MQIKEAIEKIDWAKTLCDACMGREGHAASMKNAIDEALTLLKAEQPPASDFTKNMRDQCKAHEGLSTYGKATSGNYLAKKLVIACDRLDASEAAIKELVSACEMIKKRLLTHGDGDWDDGCFYYAGHSAPELEEPLNLIKAAITKYKKG